MRGSEAYKEAICRMCIGAWRVTATAILLGTVASAGCDSGVGAEDAEESARERPVFPVPGAGERRVHLQATEMDAIRAADRFPEGYPHKTREDFPQYFGDPDDHTDRAGAPGYYLSLQDDNTYRIGSYMWLPAQDIIAYQGERLRLEILGVRGDSHRSVILDPDGAEVAAFTVYRGGLEVIDFTAAKAGVYQVICTEHQPTMTAYIHVLPTG